MEIGKVYALCCKLGDTCLDVGANVGQSARLIAPLVGNAGRCVSFECHPGHFAALAMLAAEDGFRNVEPYCCALSDDVGHAILYFGDDPDAAEASTLKPELANNDRLGRTIRRLKVETDTIDRVCRERHYRPAFIKVDVEGAEEPVLAGARSVLRENLPAVLFEFGHGFADAGAPSHFNLLGELGYRLFIVDLTYFRNRPACLLDSADVLIEVTMDDLLRTAVSGGNILAVPAGKTAGLLGAVATIPFAVAEQRVTFTSPGLKRRVTLAVRRAEAKTLKGVALGYYALRSAGVGIARRILQLNGK